MQKYATAAVVLILIAVALAIIRTRSPYWGDRGAREFTDDACVQGNLTVMSTKIAGIVKDVKVSDLQEVHEGDPLFNLEDEYFRAQVDRARALVDEAKAALQSNRWRRELEQQALETERRTLTILEVEKAQLVADLMAWKLELTIAQTNLSYTKITAPGNGRIAEVHVQPGRPVSAGTHVMTFLGNIRWVDANFRRTQITNLRIGDATEIRIDAYPGQVIHGTVQEIAPRSESLCALMSSDLAGGSNTNVQRVPGKIMLEDSEITRNLRPGLSVTATVRTRR